jgi:broad specificity phosphatase PhoE
MNDATETGAAPALTRVAFWYLRQAGIAQARSAAALLRNRGIASIISSPLSRARVTAEIVGETLGLPISLDIDWQEVSFGVQEGQPMSDWFTDWVAGTATPQGAESMAELRLRSVIAANRALANPPVVLVVAHGALFRALRAEMGLTASVRTRNAEPLFCEPPVSGEGPWTLTPAT